MGDSGDGVIPTESMLKQFVSRKLGTLCGYKDLLSKSSDMQGVCGSLSVLCTG